MHIYAMVGGYSLWGFGASTVTLQHHSDLAMPQFSEKSTPTRMGVTVQGCTHMPIHSISRCSNTLYTSNMDVGCSQWGLAASTMILQHHTGSAIPHFPKIHPHLHNVLRYKGVPICRSTASQGAKTLCIYMPWLEDAVFGGLEPQP
jgi:hypothetical protein